MATTLNLNTLPDYIEQHRDELFIKSTLGSKSLDYLDIMTNVKFKEAINFLDSTVVIQDGSDCNWNPQGEDTFSQRFIEVVPVEVQKEYCWKDFRKKYMNYQLLWEAGRETLPFEEKIAQSNMNAIQEAVEDMVWQGIDDPEVKGILEIAEEESANTVNVTFASGETITEKVDKLVAAIPLVALKKGVNVFMSYTDFRTYIQESNAGCCSNRPVIDAASESISYFGDSRVTIVPVLGLEGQNAIVAFPKDAVVYGTDVENADNKYEMWYSKDDDKFRFYVLWNAGFAFRFPGEVVIGK